jgi:hypothetical protein
MPKIQNVIVVSTTKEKYMASSHACNDTIWLSEFGRMQDKVKVFCDS